MQQVGVSLCCLEVAGYDNHSAWLALKHICKDGRERVVVESRVIVERHFNMEVSSLLASPPCSFLYLLPVGFAFVLWHDDVESVRLVVSKCAGIHVWLIVNLFQNLFHLFSCGGRDIRAVVDNPVNSTHRNACSLSNVLNPNLLRHQILFYAVCC